MSPTSDSTPLIDGLLTKVTDNDPEETKEWHESLDALIADKGAKRARYILLSMLAQARQKNVTVPTQMTTPYINTIDVTNEPYFPGDEGAERIHLVDLNGAFAGKPQNASVVRAIIDAVGAEVPVQLGGGIRSLDTIERYLDVGVSYVVVGTAAVKNPGFLHDACTAFPGQVLVGLDARDGKVATDGWSKLTRHDVVDLARKFVGYGVEGIIYTDIGRDGMLSGVNIEATQRLAQAVSVPVFASGGVTDLSDIDRLLEIEDDGVGGVILGRSIYEGTLDFGAALERANGN
mgnify:CR=1 FL=1